MTIGIKYKVTAFDLKLALLQYYRHRQWICVDEFRGADIIVDTGKEIIEVEIKVTKPDLINGEKTKIRKHQVYRLGREFAWRHPQANKFLFCVPEKLIDTALVVANKINERYGVIGFDADELKRLIRSNSAIWWQNNNYFLRIAKSAKKLHENYNNELRWAIAKRTSAKIAALTQEIFKGHLKEKLNYDDHRES